MAGYLTSLACISFMARKSVVLKFGSSTVQYCPDLTPEYGKSLRRFILVLKDEPEYICKVTTYVDTYVSTRKGYLFDQPLTFYVEKNVTAAEFAHHEKLNLNRLHEVLCIFGDMHCPAAGAYGKFDSMATLLDVIKVNALLACHILEGTCENRHDISAMLSFILKVAVYHARNPNICIPPAVRQIPGEPEIWKNMWKIYTYRASDEGKQNNEFKLEMPVGFQLRDISK